VKMELDGGVASNSR
nr:RecName: Full=Zinc finger protein CONSTANS-like protein [Populus euphratica]